MPHFCVWRTMKESSADCGLEKDVFTIRAVGTDDFEDVPVPPPPPGDGGVGQGVSKT